MGFWWNPGLVAHCMKKKCASYSTPKRMLILTLEVTHPLRLNNQCLSLRVLQEHQMNDFLMLNGLNVFLIFKIFHNYQYSPPLAVKYQYRMFRNFFHVKILQNVTKHPFYCILVVSYPLNEIFQSWHTLRPIHPPNFRESLPHHVHLLSLEDFLDYHKTVLWRVHPLPSWERSTRQEFYQYWYFGSFHDTYRNSRRTLSVTKNI